MSETLKPCPFCWGEARIYMNDSNIDNILYYCMCTNDNGCDVQPYTLDHYSEEEAATAWNTRMVPGEIETALVADGTAERAAMLARWWESGFREDKRQAERTKLQDDLTRYDNLIVHCPSCGAKVIGGDAE